MLSLRDTPDVEYDTYIDANLKQPKACNAMEAQLAALQEDLDGIETVVVDSLTTLSDLAMNRILALNGRAGGTPQLQDWLQQMNWLKNFILQVKALPCHVVFIAHEQIEKDELTGKLEALPALTGKMAGKVGLYFDEVYSAQVVQKGKESEFRLLTSTAGIYMAKSRLGCFDQYEEPDFKKLQEKIYE